MNPSMEPALSLYQANVEVCREVAQILVDGTERVERALFKNVRDSVKQLFSTASAIGHTGSSAEDFKAPQLDELVGSYREILDTVIKTNAELMRIVTDHFSKYSKALAEGSGQPANVANMLTAPSQQLESMMKMWNQTSQQMAELAQHIAQSGAASVPEPPPARKSPRAH